MVPVVLGKQLPTYVTTEKISTRIKDLFNCFAIFEIRNRDNKNKKAITKSLIISKTFGITLVFISGHHFL